MTKTQNKGVPALSRKITQSNIETEASPSIRRLLRWLSRTTVPFVQPFHVQCTKFDVSALLLKFRGVGDFDFFFLSLHNFGYPEAHLPRSPELRTNQNWLYVQSARRSTFTQWKIFDEY